MIPQTQVPEEPVVLQHVVPELLDLRLVLEVNVAFKEAAVQFHYLSEREMLPGCLVQSSCCLAKLQDIT